MAEDDKALLKRRVERAQNVSYNKEKLRITMFGMVAECEAESRTRKHGKCNDDTDVPGMGL